MAVLAQSCCSSLSLRVTGRKTDGDSENREPCRHEQNQTDWPHNVAVSCIAVCVCVCVLADLFMHPTSLRRYLWSVVGASMALTAGERLWSLQPSRLQLNEQRSPSYTFPSEILHHSAPRAPR